ncbi:uncharacterized protein [Ptychodera flava]|uniref:uncharacterized protein isoform X2 n=1 Tax=Ptychodera flava TaxID=63121 RepID=UPI00396A4768
MTLKTDTMEKNRALSGRSSSTLSSWSRHMHSDPTMYGYRHRNILHGPGRDLDPHVLEDVKREAERTWNADLRDWNKTPTVRPTTYSHAFYKKLVDEPTKMRPTSPHRRNNPHPPLVFLSCRLRTVPGFHDPDAVTGKDKYIIDAKCPVEQRKKRELLRQKYISRPATASVMTYKHNQAVRNLMSPRSAQAAEAWMKVASKQDQEAVMKMVDDSNHKKFADEAVREHVKPQFQPSLRRYLKGAGAEEARAIAKLFHTIGSGQRPEPPMQGPHYHITDYGRMSKVTRHRPFQRDFVVHPELLERTPPQSPKSAKLAA